MFLANNDVSIVVIALEALEFMSLYKGHKSVMAKEEGLAPALRRLMLHSDTTVKKLSMAVYSNIQEDMSTGVRSATAAAKSTAASTANDSHVVGSVLTEPVSLKASTARTYHVYIKELADEALKPQIEATVLSIKGVLSFLIDVYARKAVIRTTTSAEALTNALKGAGFAVVRVDEHADPTKPYKTASEENKENKPNSNASNASNSNATGGGGGGSGSTNSSWFGWLVPSGSSASSSDESGSGWFSNNGSSRRRAKKDENNGWGSVLGKALWG